jgi:hypothetical protein
LLAGTLLEEILLRPLSFRCLAELAEKTARLARTKVEFRFFPLKLLAAELEERSAALADCWQSDEKLSPPLLQLQLAELTNAARLAGILPSFSC